MTEKSSTKALPQDPFEDMEDFDQQGSEEAVPEASEAQATASDEPKVARSKTSKGKKKAKAKIGTGQKSKKKDSGHTSRATVKRKKSAGKESGHSEIRPDVTTPDTPESTSGSPNLPDRVGPDTDLEMYWSKRQSAEMDPVPDQTGEHGSDHERPLDELIAIIDEEIDETFGPGAMRDLDQDLSEGVIEAEQHVIFSLGDTVFAVPISHVTEIGRPLNVSPVPNVPGWLLGVANLRGEIISMVDMRAFLGMERMGFDRNRRMIVAEAIREDLRVGFIVDRVTNIGHLEVARISEPTAKIDDQVARYLRGVYEHEGQLLVLLDLDRLLLSAEMRRFEPL